MHKCAQYVHTYIDLLGTPWFSPILMCTPQGRFYLFSIYPTGLTDKIHLLCCIVLSAVQGSICMTVTANILWTLCSQEKASIIVAQKHMQIYEQICAFPKFDPPPPNLTHMIHDIRIHAYVHSHSHGDITVLLTANFNGFLIGLNNIHLESSPQPWYTKGVPEPFSATSDVHTCYVPLMQ